MEFIVPQFIEKEPKIVGPFTFKQFIFIGIAGGLSILLFFIVPFWIFLVLSIILLTGAFGLAFLKIERTSLPVYIKNLVIFIFKPKIYLWQKKNIAQRVSITPEEKQKNYNLNFEKKTASPKLKRGGHLQDLFTHLGIK